MPNPSHASGPRRLPLTFLPVAAAALLPKCPLCLMSITGALGLSSSAGAAWLRPLTFSLLGAVVVSLALRARRGRGYAPALLGLAATAVLFIGKFYIDNPAATYGGAALLFTATLWRARPPECAAQLDDDCHC